MNESLGAVAAACLTAALALCSPAAGATGDEPEPGAGPLAKPTTCAGEAPTIVGTKRPDRIEATKRVDVIVSKGGADRISGVDDADVVCSGGGRDRVGAVIARGRRRMSASQRSPFPLVDAWVLGEGDDRLTMSCPNREPGGFFQADFPPVDGAGGDDVIVDDCSLAEYLDGGPGNDRIVAGAGYDQVYGSGGDDTLIDRFSKVSDCDPDPPPVPGFTGPNHSCVLIADGLWHPFEDLWAGEAGDDLIIAAEAYDVVEGADGDDELYGGGGNDSVSGGPGTDYCDGGDGDGDRNARGPSTYDEHDCETELGMEDPQ